MIQDGYTIQKANGVFIRPLSHQGADRIRLLIESNAWDEIDETLWNPPSFFGDAQSLSDSDRMQLLQSMITFDLDAAQKNLTEGLLIRLTRPLLEKRSCNFCKEFLFDSETDLLSMRGSDPIRRKPHFVLACDTHEGCPKGHHSNPVMLTRENEQAWQHFLDWRAVGLTDSHKNCPVLRSNWSIMQGLVDRYGIPRLSKKVY